MKIRKLPGLLIASTLAFCASTVSAVPVFYTNQADFLAAAGSSLGFESYEVAPDTFAAQYDFSGFSVSETNGIDALTNVLINGAFGTTPVTDGNGAIWYDDNGDSLSHFFSFASGVNAFGLDITTSEASTVTITGSGFSTTLSLGANMPTFFGVIDTMVSDFSPITFNASGGPLVGFDSTYYGTAVPEPASLALLGLGLLGMGFVRRRQVR